MHFIGSLLVTYFFVVKMSANVVTMVELKNRRETIDCLNPHIAKKEGNV